MISRLDSQVCHGNSGVLLAPAFVRFVIRLAKSWHDGIVHTAGDRWEVVTMACTHLEQIRDIQARTEGCAECLETGDSWVHLRMCLTCGHVGCCDSSKNRHATKHFEATGHAIIQSHQPGETWRWCYVDQEIV